ncbi:hypothetical protein GGS24DRAFT_459793 [Hypoxylon argillaceum]|nr:hypothetical protein GGS24DRAFT_459793 [Hypoxylon argillaceum]
MTARPMSGRALISATIRIIRLLSTISPCLALYCDTMLPFFPCLRRAEEIYIHGLIDTSIGPNIFPALTFISGNVTIEALNDGFDCSKLVSQWNDKIIDNLKCNVRNNQTVSSVPSSDNGTGTSPLSPSQSLPQGARVGIGFGASLAAIGILAALVWLVLNFLVRLRI